MQKASEKTANQIFLEVKRIRHDLIRAHQITDKELQDVISKVKSGTRNVFYLTNRENYRRLVDISAYIVREYSYS